MTREEMPYINWASKHLTVDSRKLERWCLKTVLNFSFGRNLIIGPGTHEPGTVPVELARVAFGLEEFAVGRGIYTAFRQGETFNLDDHFNYVAKAHEAHLVMGSFGLCGLRFYLNLFPTADRVLQGMAGWELPHTEVDVTRAKASKAAETHDRSKRRQHRRVG